MTTHSLRRQALVTLAGLLALLVVFGAPGLTATEQDDKTIFLTAVDKDGKSVTDLKTEEVLIREDNQDRTVVSVKKSTQPLAIVILADTTQQAGATGMMSSQTSQTGAAELIRDIRSAIGLFVREIAAGNPESQMQLMEFGQAAVPVTKMTSNVADLEKGVTRLFPKPKAASVLLEAIIEGSKELSKTKTPRHVIVALNIEPGDEQSRQNIRQLNDELYKSRANLWAVSLQIGQNRNQMRGLVLEALTKNTGGRREFIHAQSALEAMMKNFAENLLNQYEVTYKRPAGVKAQAVQVGVMRQGLGLFASIFAPQ
jgi:hypothetical protein